MNLSEENSTDLDFIAQTFCHRIENDVSDRTRFNAAFAISSLNLPIWILVLLGNIVVLIALKKVTSLHPPSKLLFRNLALTDLFVGLITQPLYILYFMIIANEHWDICLLIQKLTHVTTYILCGVSLLTVTGISVDRLLALLMGTRYRQVVTLTRVRILLLFVWILVGASSIMLVVNFREHTLISAIMIAMLLALSTFCYTKIFVILRSHQKKIRGNDRRENNENISSIDFKQYRKSVSTALWINYTLIACYLPLALVLALKFFRSVPISTILVSWGAAQSLVYLKSLLNPILYCWRIKEVREEAKNIL